MEPNESRITEEIAGFVEAIQFKDVPPEAHHIAKRCIIDGIGVILAGIAEPCALIVRDHVLSIGGHQECSFLGQKQNRVPAHLAALVNGTAGHAMDWDDTALAKTPDKAVLLHPTLPLLAAVLAMGEKLAVSGQALLTAFITGFEVECKIAEAIHPDHWFRGFHTSNTCGIFGATAAVAKLMGLDAERVRSAFGIAASMAAGINVNHGTMVKPLHMGRAAENGIVCAQLSASGYQSHPDALESHKGFFHAFAGGFDPEKIQGKLGRPFSILDPGVCIKPYPCGVVGHQPMEGMKDLAIEHDLQPEDVAHVKVSTGSNVLPPKGPLVYKIAQTALQGKFCVPFQIACMIIRRKAGLREFSDEFVQSAPVQEMMGRIEAVIDPEIDALGRDKIVSIIEVQLKDGRILRGKSPELYRGGPQNPLSREALAEKFNDCVQQILKPDQAEKLMGCIESLEDLDSIRELVKMTVV
jgi:2-methylcitrate dehydratase PrpD